MNLCVLDCLSLVTAARGALDLDSCALLNIFWGKTGKNLPTFSEKFWISLLSSYLFLLINRDIKVSDEKQ